ncbi:DNA-binding response regulator, OmpR family, contains REC and winged-helix (wHTH) domain [Draconibacterium orientale]|uniref:DNA-binding response regulator, OmpR family, contains REC and winged-helix (WHTH) domain n=1 Tax=Draconibacterium orientale TaxID=1168034 RepID=X5DVW7_9BACT|nr:response regulator transcription factor [Draconibacterium orientale]AHW59330.1 transcriptional regulator [Draconibacterium orientale]SET83572.1 DNA-binding response regulator, OmpR family, contains REC and winged-helix (wHTH) domain [Draconibacterium orientale]
MTIKQHIFLVEDDLSFGAVLKSYLELNDFEVTWVDDGKYAVDKFIAESFQICILDVMLPNIDGFTIGTEIRKLDANIPMVFLTAKTLKEDILKGYNVGADDYITKPFDTEVLLCKIQAIIKRQSTQPVRDEFLFSIGSYSFDSKLRSISRNGEKQKLSPKEADLLKLLCQNKNELLSRETALRKIWGEDGYFTARSMDVFITKLRKYLKDDPNIEIKNIHGSGFLLEVNS